jgi:hypothetical protein
MHTAKTHPPTSSDSFLHYWQCCSTEASLRKDKWLKGSLKKLNERLEDVRRSTPTDDDVLGWGIHVIEGMNVALVSLLTVLVLLFSGGISVGYSIGRKDVSSAFAIGAYIETDWVAFVTALYF